MSTLATAPKRGFFTRLYDDLAELRHEPRELWVIYALTLLECLAYYAIYDVLALFLREDLGYGDVAAGKVLATWLLSVSVIVFFAGFIADSLGVRRTLLLASASCVVGRLVLTFGHSRTLAFVGLYTMTVGAGALTPTKVAAIRQYTRPHTVAFGFGLFYQMVNIGSVAVGPLVSWFRSHLAEPRVVALPGGIAWHMGSAQALFAISTVASVVAFVLTLVAVRPDHLVARRGETADAPNAPFRTAAPSDAKPRATRNPLRVFAEVISDRDFWRFLLFVSLLVLVRLIFQHAHLTWPVYATRQFGRTFPYATYWSLNPLLVIILTPIATALTRRRSAFSAIVIGTFVTTASVFFMAVSTSVAASVAFIVVLSIGEVIWSPRLYEYTATIAPRGRESSYMGLSQLPMFAAKPFVSGISGYLLASYCPAQGPRHPETLWLVVGLTTLAGPVLVLALRRVIEAGRGRQGGDGAPSEEPTADAAE